jgi:hypothetical protein
MTDAIGNDKALIFSNFAGDGHDVYLCGPECRIDHHAKDVGDAAPPTFSNLSGDGHDLARCWPNCRIDHAASDDAPNVEAGDWLSRAALEWERENPGVDLVEAARLAVERRTTPAN